MAGIACPKCGTLVLANSNIRKMQAAGHCFECEAKLNPMGWLDRACERQREAHGPVVSALICHAARAAECIDEDELERFAEAG